MTTQTSFVPQSKLLGFCFALLISYSVAILFSLPFYFIEGKIIIYYFLFAYLAIPLINGAVTTMLIGYHRKSSVLKNIFCSQLALIIIFIAWGVTFQSSNLGYVGAFLVMYFPILMAFTAMGTMIGCEWLLRNGRIDID